MKSRITVVFLFTFALLFTSCSTIIKGSSQVINITSEPSDAEVLIDGNSMGKTPLSVSLKKNTYSTIMLKKEGYTAQIKQLQKSYDPLTLVNIFWDLSTTDMISGAAFEYQPGSYFFNLEKASATK